MLIWQTEKIIDICWNVKQGSHETTLRGGYDKPNFYDCLNFTTDSWHILEQFWNEIYAFFIKIILLNNENESTQKKM